MVFGCCPIEHQGKGTFASACCAWGDQMGMAWFAADPLRFDLKRKFPQLRNQNLGRFVKWGWALVGVVKIFAFDTLHWAASGM